MADDLGQVDPNWAWSPYEPDNERPWNRAMAAHLFRRAGFALNSRQLDEIVHQHPVEVVRRLAGERSQSQSFGEQIEQMAGSVLATGDPKNLSAWWLYRMLNTPDQLLEKTTLFWHGHFATSAAKVEDAESMLQQNRLLRQYALGDFQQLVHEVSRDPAMLVYLDSATNRKAHPNENYARELMELFCLGEGNYSEKDIQELARCFTGWEVKRGKFRFNRYQHDFGAKQVLGEQGEFSGDEGVDLVLKQPATARFIVRKLVRYFVCDEPEASDALIEPLTRQFRDQQLQVGPIVERILSSQLFFSRHAVGRKVRSPVELAVGLMRALEGTTNVYVLARELQQIGQGLFYPPNVKGWDGGRTWINSSTLLGRANLVRGILQNEKTRFARSDLEQLVSKYGLKQPPEIVDWLLELLVAVPLPEEVRLRLVELVRDAQGDTSQRVGEVIHAISVLPEFQLA